MALWPFRRKGSRKRSEARGRPGEVDAPTRAMTEPPIPSGPMPGGTPASSQGLNRSKSRKQRDTSSNKKLKRRGRTYSFSPGRPDSIRVARQRQESVPPLPAGPIPAGTNEKYDDKDKDPPGSIEENDITDRVPTLHHNTSKNKRRGQPLPRRKSSKRRKEDHDREAEIKAMSQSYPMPTRAATESWTAGKPTKKDSKRMRSDLVRDWQRPDSDISLPYPESSNSAMSSDSEHISYKVSAFDALAPRPTIRYASNPMYGTSTGSGTARSPSQKRKLSERGPIPEATLKAHKRIDDLADELDASDLRQLMDRDKRRRERKREKEQERVERRLARRAARQKAEEAEAKRNGTPPPQNLDRGVLGRESVPIAVDTTSAVITSSRRRPSVESPRKQEKRPAQSDDDQSEVRERVPSPLDKFHRVDSMPAEPASVHATKPEEPLVPEEPQPRSSRSPSPKLMDFIRSKKRRSRSPPGTEPEKVEEKPSAPTSTRVVSNSQTSDSGGRPSESGSSRAWMSIFKWSRNAKTRRSSGPSSFSNTSRDSMPISQPPSQASNYIQPYRSNSKLPKRTMSRFREDLPELPLSPPDSRVASPEVEPHPAEPLPVIPDDVVMRYDTPTSGHRATPSSMHRDEIQTSPAPQSMSLASIDSEGSWLSGGRITRKRASSGMRSSLANYPLRSESEESEEHDDDAMADDDFLNIVVDDKLHRKSTGDARPSSDEEDADEQSPKWGNVNQIPTFAHYRETMRSREGLLQSYDDDDKEFGIEKDSEDGSSMGRPSPPAIPQRATSINFARGHVRNFSAGSAKLLEISPRVSSDRRRSAQESITQ
ncbi:hypothetical protein BJ170DRAFT_248017 [Xylariales sp. AK1849]|nr:hypothetical protein BJ170DRAFT_248017 [Xylariales sp. AK1849]